MIRFQDVANLAKTFAPDSEDLGIGVAWGDFNGDLFPDIYVNNHERDPASLYRNEGNRTFKDVSGEVLPEPEKTINVPPVGSVYADKHGTAWADFDNDGDQDLAQFVGIPRHRYGPRTNNQLFINEGIQLRNRANQLGVEYGSARGRGALWVDFDNDGQLDLLMGAIPKSGDKPLISSIIFGQGKNGFSDSSLKTDWKLSDSTYSSLSDLTGDSSLDLITFGKKHNQGKVFIYDISSIPFKELSLGEISSTVVSLYGLPRERDFATADFNGDLLPDLYLGGESKPNGQTDRGRLFINAGQELVDRSKELGLNFDNGVRGVAVADFDNDMDMDLYVGDRLYENNGKGKFISLPNANGAASDRTNSVTTADYDLDGFIDIFAAKVGSSGHKLFRNQGNSNHWLEIDLEGVASNRDGIGASVVATTPDGVKQLREQSGGSHKYSQNHTRLHFGLANNTSVDELKIRWPNGKVQEIENIPADQLIRIVEPSGAVSPGNPESTPAAGAKVLLWQDTFDGPFHLRTIGSGDATQFAINLIGSDVIREISPNSLEAKDRLQTTDYGFSLNSNLIRQQDGVDFRLAPGAKALLSVTQDGVANPRQLQVGGQESNLAPAGWILGSDDFSQRPSFQPGKDLGLFVGKGAKSDRLEFRWNGDGKFHRADLSVLTSQETVNFSAQGLDLRDKLTTFENGVEIDGSVSSDADGLDVTVPDKTQVGFTYKQDGLFQSHRVNPFDDLLGLPNAYELPVADPYGRPESDASQDAGLFLWKDEESGVWELRATAGGGGASYKGSIVADRAAVLGQAVQTEGNDTVDTSDPLRIDFGLNVTGSNTDGIQFRFPEETDLTLKLEGDAAPLRVGSERWPVGQVPLDLSGWA